MKIFPLSEIFPLMEILGKKILAVKKMPKLMVTDIQCFTYRRYYVFMDLIIYFIHNKHRPDFHIVGIFTYAYL